MFNATRIVPTATCAARIPLGVRALSQPIQTLRFNSTTPEGHKTYAQHDPRVADQRTAALQLTRKKRTFIDREHKADGRTGVCALSLARRPDGDGVCCVGARR